MRPHLSTNAQAILGRMHARSARVRSELERAARDISNELTGEAKRVLQDEVYNVPIPLKASADRRLSPTAAVRSKTTKGKLGQWTRTGNLKRRERGKAQGPVVIMENTARYSLARHNLGTSKGRQIRSKGVKSVQWHGEAIKRKRGYILKRRRDAVLRALRGR